MSSGPETPRTSTGLRAIGRALAHRNFRLFFAGQSISLIGTWMQQIAMNWLVYRLTDSAWLLGLVAFCNQIPTFFLSPFAGVLTDRWNRHRILIATQSLAMVQAFVLAFLTLSHLVQIWHIISLGVFLGLVNAFDMTTRQAFMTDMVEGPEDLANAIALNSSMVNGARLVGPSLAGMVIALVGEGLCFLLNGISYLAVIAALLAMRLRPQARATPRPRMLKGLKEGFYYAFGFAPIRSLLLLLAVVSLVGAPYTVLMPVFATQLGGGAETLGFLMAASGVGALIGALYLASRRTILGLGVRIAVAPAIFGLGLIAFTYSPFLWLCMVLLLFTGFAFMVQMAASNTILQTIVEDDKRGRVMSFYAMAFMGTMPLGSLLAGVLASDEVLGAPNTLRIGGLFCLIVSAVFALRLPLLRESVRPIYVRMGIVPEVASALQTTSEMTVPPEH